MGLNVKDIEQDPRAPIPVHTETRAVRLLASNISRLMVSSSFNMPIALFAEQVTVPVPNLGSTGRGPASSSSAFTTAFDATNNATEPRMVFSLFMGIPPLQGFEIAEDALHYLCLAGDPRKFRAEGEPSWPFVAAFHPKSRVSSGR